MAATTILHHLERHAAESGDKPALLDKLTGTWRTRTFSEYNRLTRQAGRAMLALGLDTGDVVTVLGANRPEWVISALGAMRIGGISAGIYTTCSADEIGYILGHSESPLLVVENGDQLSRVFEAWASAADRCDDGRRRSRRRRAGAFLGRIPRRGRQHSRW
jgi:long-chain acyl-CoA synthetase